MRFYIDENVSGSTFERKAFLEMVSDFENGRIGCIVVKDLSRLGRDLITISYYIEEFFPSKKVSFVSVNDQFDTIDGINNLIGSTSRIRVPLVNAFGALLEIRANLSKKTRRKAKGLRVLSDVVL